MARTTSTSTLVLVLLGLLLAGPLLFAGGGMMAGGPMGSHGPMMGDGGMWHGMTDGTAGWWFLVGLATRIVVLAAVVGIAYLAYRHVTGADETDPAVEELRRAYARGDLTDEEYDQRRERLDDDHSF